MLVMALIPLAASYNSDHHQNAQHPRDATSNDSLAGDVRVAPDQPKAAQKQQQANQGPGWGTWPDWVIVAFTAMLTLVAFLQHRLEKKLASDTADSIEIARRAAEASHKAAEAAAASVELAREAVEIDRKALVSSQGPWLALQRIEATSDLIWNNDAREGRLEVGFIFSNVGNSPANSAFVHAKLAVNFHFGNVEDVRAVAKSGAKTLGRIVYPQGDHAERISLPISEADILAAIREYGDGAEPDGYCIFVSVIGCAGYRSAVLGTVHTTPFVYTLDRKPDAKGNQGILAFRDNVSRSELSFRALPISLGDPD